MGTTKDPEGFRRHSSGRRQVLGGRPLEETPKRGCGLAAALLGAGLVLAAAAWLLGGERGEAVARAPVAATPGARASEEPLELVAPVAAAEDGAPRAVVRTETSPFAPRAPRAWPRTQSGTAVASLSIQLLRGWTETPLADAEVLWLGRGELQRMRADGLAVTTVDFEPVLRSHGRSARSDAAGRLTITADGCHLLVIQEEWTRELEVVPIAGEPTRVRVFAPRELVVDVLDWRGAPVAGFPIEFWGVDAEGTPQRALRSSRTSRTTGGLHMEDVDAMLHPGLSADPTPRIVNVRNPDAPEPLPIEPSRVRVALDAELAPNAWQEIDLAQDPLPHVVLRLPPLGELSVVVAQSDGSPVSWVGYVELRDAEGSRYPDGPVLQPITSDLHDGRAEFTNLRFGHRMRIVAVRTEGPKLAKGDALEVEPLTPDDSRRELVLPDVWASPRAFLRPLDSGGRALPSAWVNVRFQALKPLSEDERRQLESLRERRFEGSRFSSSTPIELAPPPVLEIPTHRAESWTRVVRCDLGGRIEVPLPDLLLAAERGQLLVSIVREGKTFASEEIVLERDEAWGDLDLGNVLLQER